MNNRFTKDFSKPTWKDPEALPPRTFEPDELAEWKTAAVEGFKTPEVTEVTEVPKPTPPRDPIRTSGYSLIPPEPMGEIARVFQIGAEKYTPRGWEDGLPWSSVYDRIYKHLGRWQRGEKFDLEDGQHNLASVAWAALVLMEYEKTHPEKDDIHMSTEEVPGTIVPGAIYDSNKGVEGAAYGDVL